MWASKWLSQSEQCGKNKTYFLGLLFSVSLQKILSGGGLFGTSWTGIETNFWLDNRAAQKNRSTRMMAKNLTKNILLLSRVRNTSLFWALTFYRSHVLSHTHALALMKTLKDMHATSHIDIHANATDTLTRTMQTHNHKITLARIRSSIASFNTHPVFASKVVLLQENFFLLWLFRCWPAMMRAREKKREREWVSENVCVWEREDCSLLLVFCKGFHGCVHVCVCVCYRECVFWEIVRKWEL